MTTAKVFMSGNSQAVRLPKEVQLDVGEVELTRDGEAIVMASETKAYGQRMVELFQDLSANVDLPDDSPPQQRASRGGAAR